MTHTDAYRRSPSARWRGAPLALSLWCALACTWPISTMAQSSPAEEPGKVLSSDEISKALAPPTRGISFPTRGLSRKPSSQADQSVNLNIPFELNSSALKPQATEQLKQLELALASPALGNNRFIVAGHTDAKGSAEYNKQLSLRRAETVKHFLIEKGIDAKRLDTVGYGSEKPLSPDHPDDPSNRRVEIRAVAAQ